MWSTKWKQKHLRAIDSCRSKERIDERVSKNTKLEYFKSAKLKRSHPAILKPEFDLRRGWEPYSLPIKGATTRDPPANDEPNLRRVRLLTSDSDPYFQLRLSSVQEEATLRDQKSTELRWLERSFDFRFADWRSKILPAEPHIHNFHAWEEKHPSRGAQEAGDVYSQGDQRPFISEHLGWPKEPKTTWHWGDSNWPDHQLCKFKDYNPV